MTKRILLAIFILTSAARGRAEAADYGDCWPLDDGTEVTIAPYYQAAYTDDNMLCSADTESCALKGLLFKMRGAKNAPAVILNHGAAGDDAANDVSSFLCAARQFLRKGFVVLLPIRRGVTHTGFFKVNDIVFATFIQSTGRDPVSVAQDLQAWHDDGAPLPRELDAATLLRCSQEAGWTAQKECLKTHLTHQGSAEVAEAIYWLERQRAGASPLVNPDETALVGHSDGGKVSVFTAGDLTAACALDGEAAQRLCSLRPNVVVSLSMAESGDLKDNPTMLAELEDAVAVSDVPLALLQAANAENRHSTQWLGKQAAQHGKRYLAQVFPPVPGTHVHSDFLKTEAQVDHWGPVARLFMALHGVE
jgi:dienelactone hydrolase